MWEFVRPWRKYQQMEKAQLPILFSSLPVVVIDGDWTAVLHHEVESVCYDDEKAGQETTGLGVPIARRLTHDGEIKFYLLKAGLFWIYL